MTIKAHAGLEATRDTLELPDDATPEQIDAAVKAWTLANLKYGWHRQ